jgi:two-component system chemotaxis response regulator CheY
MFTRDQRTGSMKQFTPGEPKNFGLAPDEAGPLHSRVLVAHDGEANRFLTIWRLGKAWPVEGDMMVECAADGAEALEKIRSKQYALVVLDWNMPLFNGADVLRAIRENDLRVPVVVMSDQRREAIASHLETMAAAFVNKDEFDTGSLRNAIAASIQLQEGRAQVVPSAIAKGAHFEPCLDEISSGVNTP